MPMLQKIVYFEKPGRENTREIAELVKERAKELGIHTILVATRTGKTALEVAEVFLNEDIKIIGVAHSYGNSKQGKWLVKEEFSEKLKQMKVSVVTSIQPFGSFARLFHPEKKPGLYPLYLSTFPLDVMADTLRLFCQGMKVCVEIALMVADMGLIPMDREIIAIAGTQRGADTAVVMRPAHTSSLFNLRIREIIAKPRAERTEQPPLED